jgi:hypothetical protein
MAKKAQLVEFAYHSIRRITAPDDSANDREVYSGHAPAESFLNLPDDENVRDYLLDAEGRKKRTPTQVHKAIRNTLDNSPENFSILNGGIVVVARALEVDDKKKRAILTNPSIINGSQTQGEIREYLRRCNASGEAPYPVHVTFELIVTLMKI